MKTFPLTEKQKNYFFNTAQKSKSGLIGVYWHEMSKKWQAKIQTGMTIHHIGSFENKEDAARARDQKAIELWGEDAVTNKRLGLLSDSYMEMKIPKSLDEIVAEITTALPRHLHAYGKTTFLKITHYKNKGTTLKQVLRNEPSLNAMSKKDRAKVLLKLEELNLIKIVRQGNLKLDNCKVFQVCYFDETQYIQPETVPQKEIKMSENIIGKTPEELERMAKELMALSEVKKKEIANGDHLKKIINPILLRICQAKGEMSRALDAQVDAMSKLEVEIEALKQALK